MFAGHAICGPSASVTVTTNEQSAEIPLVFTTRNDSVCDPTENEFPDPIAVRDPRDETTQSNVDGLLYVTLAAHIEASLLTLIFDGHVICGLLSSSTMIVNEHEAVFPEASVAVYCTKVSPRGNTEPDASPPVKAVETEQASLPTGAVYDTVALHKPGSRLTFILLGHEIVGGVWS